MKAADTISSLEIAKSLPSDLKGLRLIVVDETDSTNKMARELAREGETGFAVIADRQLKGKGRGDHVWESPPGGIYLSLIIGDKIPKRGAPLLNLTLGVAAAETILQMTGAPVFLKWPNDIYLGDKKLGGILIEAATGPVNYIVAGIGINLNCDIAAFSPQIRREVSSLSGETGVVYDRNLFLANLISSILKWVDITVSEPRKVVDEWSRISYTIGKKVSFVLEGRRIDGIAVGVDIDGFLMVKDSASGLTEKIVSADIVREICS